MKTYQEKVFAEIIQVIKDNLKLLYNYDDDTLRYCNKNNHCKYKSLTYNKLINFTEETTNKLINVPYIYDFRPLVILVV